MTQEEIKREKERKILEISKYIIENKATIEVTANHFGISISSIKKYINDKNNLPSINNDLYIAVKEVQKGLIKIGNQVGGKNGVATPSISDFEITEILEQMLNNNLTLSEASLKYDRPVSTIYDRLMKIDDPKTKEALQELFYVNKHHQNK